MLMSRYTWNHEHIWNDKDKLTEAVRSSKSLRSTLVYLGIEPSSRRYSKLKDQCAKFDIDLNFDTPWVSDKRIPDDLVFTNTSPFTRDNGKELKDRALKLGYITNECLECGQEPVWNGKPLTLHLDHIDGDYRNNLPNNLRMLCPNCHTQTKTYGYRNHKKETCINGHPWVPENLWKRKKGNVCKICARNYNKASRMKEKERNGWASTDS